MAATLTRSHAQYDDLIAILGKVLVASGPVVIAATLISHVPGRHGIILGVGLIAIGLIAIARAWGRRWRHGPESDLAFFAIPAHMPMPWAGPLPGGSGVESAAERAERALPFEPAARPYRGPSPILLFITVMAVDIVVAFAILDTGITISAGPGALIDTLLLALVAFGLIQLTVVSPGWLTWREMGFRLPAGGDFATLSDIVIGLLLAIPTIILAGIVGGVLIAVLGTKPEAPVQPSLDFSTFAMQLIAAGFIGPFWEESFFRGFATTAWWRTRGYWWALLGGAFFFAAIHAPGLLGSNPAEALPKAFLATAIRIPAGLALGWIYLHRRSLVAAVALHVAYNAISLLVYFLTAMMRG